MHKSASGVHSTLLTEFLRAAQYLQLDYMRRYDVNSSSSMDLDEFAVFCEDTIYKGKSVHFIEKRTKGFLEVLDRRSETIKAMWRSKLQHEVHPNV